MKTEMRTANTEGRSNTEGRGKITELFDRKMGDKKMGVRFSCPTFSCHHFLLGYLVLVASLVCGHAAPLGSAFTYQGRLTEGGQPAGGEYDLRFALYDADAGGNQSGLAVTNENVWVTNGVFTTALDFGTNTFNGQALWLEIAVRPGASPDAFTNVTPRQAITATPYALRALSFSGVLTDGQLAGTYGGAVNFSNAASRFNGSFSGNGGGLTNLSAASLTGPVPVAALSNVWRVGGNAGTIVANNFLGTTDNQSLELRVNNARALRLQPDASPQNAPNIIGGSPVNTIAPGIVGATIAGGGSADYEGNGAAPNTVGLSYGTVGGGVGNATTGVGATIGGGYNNTSIGFFATVAGGGVNVANGDYAFVGGGLFNQATSTVATVAGGRNNRALGIYSSVGGGTNVQALGGFSTASGGKDNLALVSYSTVGGGLGNTSSSSYATVGGGNGNVSSGSSSTIAGGIGNLSSGGAATVGGGNGNESSGVWATVGGGLRNLGSASYSTVGGGGDNQATVTYATVGGGEFNRARGAHATVAGGWNNEATNTASAVGGGRFNRAYGSFSTIGGGANGQASDGFSTVGGGSNNTASGESATVGGGQNNSASANGSTVAGGRANSARGYYSAITGGSSALASGDFSFVGGGHENRATNTYSLIAGGYQNRADGYASTVGGGYRNESVGSNSVVAGGRLNVSSGKSSTIGGGSFNESTGEHSTVAGGNYNLSTSLYSTVGGGLANEALGFGATVPGGHVNRALGDRSFAAGYGARADHAGAFVWADNQGFLFSSSAQNQFLIRASGGVGIGHENPNAPLHVTGGSDVTLVSGGHLILGPSSGGNLALDGNEIMARNNGGGATLYLNASGAAGVSIGTAVSGSLLRVFNATCDGSTWNNASDRNLKSGFAPVDARAVLAKVAALPLQSWHYTNAPGTRHVGPMAQDFHAAFGLGADDKLIATVDADGVALAAIQGLNSLVQTQAEELRALKGELAELRRAVNSGGSNTARH